MNQKNQKGITLIALVITIIVLLILAGVTINMVLGDDGIIKQAQDASDAQENLNVEDQVKLAAMAAMTNKEYTLDGVVLENALTSSFGAKGTGYGLTGDATTGFTVTIGEKQYKISSKGTVEENVAPGTGGSGSTEGLTREEVAEATNNTITEATDGVIKEVKTFSDGIVPIPMEFTYLTGDTVDGGVVVKDEYGNEFVWIPVDGTNVKLERNQSWTGGDNNWQEPLLGQFNYSLMGNITDAEYEQEYEDMVESVGKYGGFYVGRYETNTSYGSKPNQPSINMKMWYELYNGQKALHAESSSVVSGMIYGCQWDAIMGWMSGIVNPNALDPETTDKYVFDSTGMGHFCFKFVPTEGYVQITETVAPINTGSNPNYAIKNIYDLAGNYSELTHEARSGPYVVERGGSCFGGISWQACSRIHSKLDPDWPDKVSSRLQLYIK